MRSAFVNTRFHRTLICIVFYVVVFYGLFVFVNSNKKNDENSTNFKLPNEVTRSRQLHLIREKAAEEVKRQKAIELENEKRQALEQETKKRQEALQLAFKKSMDKVENENSKRLETIKRVCQRYGLGLYKKSQCPSFIKHPPVPQYQVFFFDSPHKISFCPIYKAGSTSWLHNMLLLAGLSENEIKSSKKQLSELARENFPQMDPNAAEELLQSTTKIMTVRHPFERILSAYRDKLENINHGWEHGTRHFYNAFGKEIVKKYRMGGNNTKTQDLLTDADVLRNPQLPAPAGIEPTFQEFVSYLIDSDLVNKADDHWIPYYLYCTPCLLNYEFIAKTETLDADQTYIIQSLGLGNKIKAHWEHKTQFIETGDPTKVSEVAKVYFHQLSIKHVFKLYEKYRIDFELFGYDFWPYMDYTKELAKNEQKD